MSKSNRGAQKARQHHRAHTSHSSKRIRKHVPFRKKGARNLRHGQTLGAVSALIAQAETRPFRELLTHLGKAHPRLVLEYYGALKRIADELPQSVRALHSVQLKSKSQVGKLRELVAHLFAFYDLPACLDNAFIERDRTSEELALALGRGVGVRAAARSFSLSKKEAHYFLHAPKACGGLAAIRYAQARVAGFDEQSARIAMRTTAQRETDLRALFQHLARLELAEDLEIVLTYCLTKMEEEPKGRVFEQSEHALRVHARNAFNVGGFKKSPLKALKFCDALFVELQSAWQLRVEGQRLSHCIFSYRQKAKSGKSWIFSMRTPNENLESKRALTIEICARTERIVQVRGYRNRRASDEESEMLARFAEANGIVFVVGTC